MERLTLRAALAAACLALVACAGPVTQVAVPPVQTDLRLRPVIASLELRDLSLPRYAAADDVARAGLDGGIGTLPGTVWADTPERALTLRLADALERITGARVAVEPWPFAEPPSASVTVRVTDALGQAGAEGTPGRFVLRGSYAIAPVASDLADRDGRFDIAVPLADDSPQTLAAAQSATLGQLAETLARRIAR
ncbi:PqiC family protein [Meridianimarinicoccus sp. RP-17]